MGYIPGVGFKTDVVDTEKKNEIVRAICDEFPNITSDDETLKLDGGGNISYAILKGSNGYFGMTNDGLVFSYIPFNFPNWKNYVSQGSVVYEIHEFVTEEFEDVDCDDVYPIITHQ